MTEKEYQVRNFAEVRNFAWHRIRKKRRVLPESTLAVRGQPKCLTSHHVRMHRVVFYTGPASSRCSCIGPRASGVPTTWCLGRLLIFPDTPYAREFCRNGL